MLCIIVLSVKAKAECLFQAGIGHNVSEQFLNLDEVCSSSLVSVLRLEFLNFLLDYFTIYSDVWLEIHSNSTIYLFPAQDKFGDLALTRWQLWHFPFR